MVLFLLSLVAGILTVLAPCTISLLPVIVGGSLAGGSSFRRTLVVTTSLGVSVILFTLLLKVSTAFISVPQSFWEIFSGIIIVFLGLTMIFPTLWDRLSFVGMINRDSNKLLATGYLKQNVIGDVLVGAALGPVFSSCSPTYFLIIATVLPRSLLGGSIYLLAYTVGLCGTLLVVAIAGQKILDKLGVAADPNGWLKRGIGILFLIVGLAIAFGLDAKIELAFANSGILDVSGLEQKFLQAAEPGKQIIAGQQNASSTMPMPGDAGGTVPAANPNAAARIAAKALVYPQESEITKPSGFINTNGAPITLAGLKGKVVLVDFWDYSCINCEREIPYVEAWYKKYAPDGLVVVGIHTPEFAFEKVQSNVEAAVKSFGITYPVVLDNDYSTWNAFGNQFWPQIYLIDSDGFIVYSHSGEGEYPQTEAQIQKALAERNMIMGTATSVPMGTVAPTGAVESDFSKVGSPETYFGYNRNEFLANGTSGQAGSQTLVLPTTPVLNNLYLGGSWLFQGEYAETNDPSAKVLYNFDAKNVYMVATSPTGAKLKILIDGAPAGINAGADVGADSTVTVKDNRLYKLISLPEYGVHTLEIEVESGTLDAYTFTFG